MTAPSEPCRFASDPEHVCIDYDGGPVKPYGVCWYEARCQVREQRVAQGLPAELSDSQLVRVAEIVRPTLRKRAAS